MVNSKGLGTREVNLEPASPSVLDPEYGVLPTRAPKRHPARHLLAGIVLATMCMAACGEARLPRKNAAEETAVLGELSCERAALRLLVKQSTLDAVPLGVAFRDPSGAVLERQSSACEAAPITCDELLLFERAWPVHVESLSVNLESSALVKRSRGWARLYVRTCYPDGTLLRVTFLCERYERKPGWVTEEAESLAGEAVCMEIDFFFDEERFGQVSLQSTSVGSTERIDRAVLERFIEENGGGAVVE